MGKMPVMNNGGVGGTGIFGMFGTIIRCDSKDDSMYCNLAKFINMLFMILFLAFILYILYYFFIGSRKSSGIKGGKGR
jgi:membrane associated rhomboid family serine protease